MINKHEIGFINRSLYFLQTSVQPQNIPLYCKALPEHFKDSEGYHSKCYKHFTATKKVNVQIDETGQCGSQDSEAGKHVLQSQGKAQRTTSAGVLDTTCIFCSQTRKRRKRKADKLGQCETHEASSMLHIFLVTKNSFQNIEI